MNARSRIFPIIAIVAMAVPALAAEPADDALAKQLEQKAIGYWAPDGDAMLKLFTEEKGMKKEEAAEAIGESAKITVHVEKGIVHLYTTQGILSTPYNMLGADKATDTLTLRAVSGDGAPEAKATEPVKVVIKEDRITMMGGMVPFILKRIEEAEFTERKKAVPADPVGP